MRWPTSVLLLLAGCATAPLPAPNITADWRVQQGQAVLTPPGLAGELLVATNSTGDFLVEFSKPPLTIATAQRRGQQWQIEFPAQKKRYSGRGVAPSRIPFLHLSPALNREKTPWTFTTNSNGWRLERKGESLEGFLSP